mgnify:CR=1 FL=1
MNDKKTVSFGMALAIIFLPILVILLGGLVLRVGFLVPLMLATITASLLSIMAGFTWKEVEACIVNGVHRIIIVTCILFLVGTLIGVWIQAGVIPLFLYCGLKLLSPSMFLVSPVLTCAVSSLMTGTSFGTIGTAGLALLGVGEALGFPTGLTAGAIVSGAYFGDKMSPVSDTTNLASGITGTNIFSHIGSMLYTTVPATLVALGLYWYLGLNYSGGAMPDLTPITDALSANFNRSFLLALPPIVLVALAIRGIPPLPTLVIAILVGVVCAFVIQDGMTVKGIVYSELPLVNFAIELGNGMLADTPAKAGLAKLTANMLNEGTEYKTPAELEEAIGTLGARISVQSGTETMVVTGSCLKKNYPQAIALVEEMLLHPRWDAQSFEVVKERMLDNIRQNAADPSLIGQQLFRKQVFGSESILSYTPDGTEQTVSGLTLDDAKAFYEANLSPSVAKVSFVGGLSQQEVVSSLGSLEKNWKAKEVETPQIVSADVRPEAKVYFIDYPGARQSYIMIGDKAMPVASPEAYPAVVVNDKLGASSGSLLFDILRLKHGYTYGAYSSFTQGIYNNYFAARSSVQATVTKESLALFRDILSGYGAEFSQEYLDQTRTALLRTMNGSFETPGALLGLLRDISIYGLSEDYPLQREKVLKEMTLEQAKAVIAKNIDFGKMVVVVVGDAKSQLSGVKALNLGKVQLVDRDGKPL